VKIKKNIAISKTGFVFDPTSGESYSINPIGMKILQQLQEESSLEDITGMITSQYDIDDVSFEKYFLDFVGMLKQFKLIDSDEEN